MLCVLEGAVIKTHEVAPWIERLARVGYVAKALLYGTIGALAALAAFSSGGRTTDTRGAMGTLLGAPMGRALLAAIALASWVTRSGGSWKERSIRSAAEAT
jgi:Domain of Unknown Function (DUF1206)